MLIEAMISLPDIDLNDIPNISVREIVEREKDKIDSKQESESLQWHPKLVHQKATKKTEKGKREHRQPSPPPMLIQPQVRWIST